MKVPPRDTLRAALTSFDENDKKVVGGVLAVMFATPDRVRDRDWIVEQFTQVALLTGQFENVGEAHEGLEVAQEWIRENVDRILNACYALFVHVADDMRQREGDGSFTASDAMLQALSYFG